MKFKYTKIAVLLSCLLLVSCSTKREYFSPKKHEITGKYSYSSSLPALIKDSNHDVATLKNGIIVDRNGMQNLKITNDEVVVLSDDNYYGISNINGNFKLINKASEVVFDRKFVQMIVSGSVSNNYLALVGSDNTLYLINILNSSMISTNNAGDALVSDSSIVSPKFFDNFIAFPTLNGKIYILDKKYGAVVRQIIAGREDYFNNIIFYEILNNSMYVATTNKLMLLSPSGNVFVNDEIKKAISHNGYIYTFLTDGTVKVYNRALKEIANSKFDFAIFSNALIVGENLYIIEKTGYIIKTDLLLKNTQIYKIPDSIKNRTFATKDSIIIGKKVIKFK